MKESKMKSFTHLSRSIFLGSIALGVLGFLAPSLTLADGKGASKLMFAPPAQVSPAQTAASGKAMMGCQRCTDGYTKVAETSAKGMRAESVKLVAVHQCSSCQTKITSSGAGKAKTDRVIHSCGMSAGQPGSCCVAAN
jgi:hypothetical protein